MSSPNAEPEPPALVTRFAVPADTALVAGLFLATWRHYWGDGVDRGEAGRRAAAAVLGDAAGCRVLLAFLDGDAVGYSTFAILYPGPTGQGVLFMKDLFVLEGARGRGIGQAMMRRIAALAVEWGCHRFDWTAETDNPRALAFYDELLAPRVREKIYYRLTGDRLAAFAREAPPA